MNDFITSLGVFAETCLIFYRSVLSAGGSDDEACMLTSMYMEMCLHYNPVPKEDGDEDDD